jgi:hypothetical protein
VANETLRFDIIAQDRASSGFSAAGRSASEAAGNVEKLTRRLDEVSRKSVAARVGLKGNDEAAAALDRLDAKLLGLDRRVASPHLKVEGAAWAIADISAMDAAIDKLGRDTDKAKKANDGWAASLQKAADSAKKGGGPAWLGPALLAAPVATSVAGVTAGAAVGVGGAALTMAGSLAAFGAVAKPVLADALKAEQKVQTAQDAYSASVTKIQGQYQYSMSLAKTQAQRNSAYAAEQKALSNAQLTQQKAINLAYAEMSPAQIALSKQLGAMSDAWSKLKAAQTPVVAGALQPWLKDVTLLTGNLAPVIASISPVIRDLGAQFGTLMHGSMPFFMSWIGTTGATVTSSVGGAVLNLLKAMTYLLPQFTPLMTGAAAAIGKWAAEFANWSQSYKATQQIQAFLDWFRQNGPLVGGLLKNIGGALKALAPGLGPASTAELQVISGFFAWIAKLPPSVAKPLVETAAILLTLNKLGVISVGVKIAGAAAGWVQKLLGGATVDVGAAGMQRAGDTMVGAAAAMQRAADTMLGGGAKGAAATAGESAAGGGAAAGGLSLLSKSAIVAGGAAIAGGLMLKIRQDMASGWKAIASDVPKALQGIGGFLTLSASGWANAILSKFEAPIRGMWVRVEHDAAHAFDIMRHDTAAILDGWRHDIAAKFDGIRHDTSAIWDSVWSNTYGRLNRGVGDSNRLLNGWWHSTASWFDRTRHDTSVIWDSAWNNTVGRASRGVGDVLRWVGSLPASIGRMFSGAGWWLFQAGQDVLQGFWNGLTFIWNKVTGWIKSLAGWIKSNKGPISFDRTLLEPAGRAIMQGLQVGLEGGFVGVRDIISGAAGNIGNQFQGLLSLGGKIGSFFSNLFGGSGAPGTSAQVKAWIQAALSIAGKPASWLGPMEVLVRKESGGDPRAANRTAAGIAAGSPEGIAQTTIGTFAQFAMGGHGNIWNPIDNLIASVRYIGAVWQSPGNIPGLLGGGGYQGYALGTSSAAPGWAWVGENGRELMHFRGGEQVYPEQAVRGGGGGNAYHITVNVPPGANMAEAGRLTVAAIQQYEKRSGAEWRK